MEPARCPVTPTPNVPANLKDPTLTGIGKNDSQDQKPHNHGWMGSLRWGLDLRFGSGLRLGSGVRRLRLGSN